MRGRLDELLQAVRDLPGEPGAAPASMVVAPGTGADASSLRQRMAAVVGELATRLEPALDDALDRADRAWDQVDALSVIDDAWRQRADALAQAWRSVGGAEALEAVLVLDTVTAIVLVLERRLAAFVRLRGNADLRPGGRPFLDVPGALAEVARRWAS